MMIVFFAKYLSAVKADEVMDRAQTGSGVQIVLVYCTDSSVTSGLLVTSHCVLTSRSVRLMLFLGGWVSDRIS